MNRRIIKIATRGSKLAIIQAKKVKEELERIYPEFQVVLMVIHTRGDKVLDVALSKIGDKGLFTQELEHALYSGKADIAVHSLKDLPTEIAPELTIGGVLMRGEVRDALISGLDLSLKDISPDVKIATSSLRRSSQLKQYVKGIKVIDIRGNVETRIRKMEEGVCDAIIMAAVGLQRLGLEAYIREIIDPQVLIPAVGQGAIAMQIRKDDQEIEEIISRVNHEPTFIATQAERIFLNRLQGGCQIPIGCYSVIHGDMITFSGYVGNLDGTQTIKLKKSGQINVAARVANDLADEFVKNGADEIIENIRNLNQE